MDDQLRKELVDYYKWIVSLAVFVLTISVALVGLLATNILHPWLLIVGWSFLGVCIFLNLLLVKRLVTVGVVSRVPEGERGKLHRFFEATMDNVRVYGTVQNMSFFLGVGFVAVGLILSYLAGGGGEGQAA